MIERLSRRIYSGSLAGEITSLSGYLADLERAKAALDRGTMLSMSTDYEKLRTGRTGWVQGNVMDEQFVGMLFEYAVVAYGRCFTSGARLRLDRDEISDKLSLQAAETHGDVIRMRNKYVAHTELAVDFELDYAYFEMLDNGEGSPRIARVATSHMRLTRRGPGFVPAFTELIREVTEILGARLAQSKAAAAAMLQQSDAAELRSAELESEFLSARFPSDDPSAPTPFSVVADFEG